MKTLDLHEAAAFLKMHPETLRQRAAAASPAATSTAATLTA